MTKFLYAVRDLKTGFCDLTTEVSDEVATRDFLFALKNQPGIIGFAPEDFMLFCVGMYDTQTGEIQPINPIRLVVDVRSVIHNEE